jgi:uncharacterized membrane protein
MNAALWIVQGLLAAVFAAAGFLKLTRSRAELQPNMPYMEDLADGTVKLIGTMELLGAVGLILPAAIGVAVLLTPVAATGLAVLMALAVFVAWGRFGAYSN